MLGGNNALPSASNYIRPGRKAKHLLVPRRCVDAATPRHSRRGSTDAVIEIRVPWACQRVKHEWGTTAICTRSVDAAPLELFAFWLVPGPGCEPARVVSV